MTKDAASALRKDWDTNPRWKGITRPYKPEDVDGPAAAARS